MSIWQILEIEPTKELSHIKSAYARKLKQCKPEVNPEGFQELRSAYELAQKYAAGLEIDDATGNGENAGQPFSDPHATSNFLLDELVKGDAEAYTFYQSVKDSKVLESLVYSETFEQNLAINLLCFTPGRFRFICFLLDEFNWHEKIEQINNAPVFKLALQNLINNASPYYLIQAIDDLKTIKSKKEAKKLKTDWDKCCAAKALTTPNGAFRIWYLQTFAKSKVKAIYALIKALEDNPQAIGFTVNYQAYARWKKAYLIASNASVPQKPKSKRKFYLYAFIFYIAMFSIRHFIDSEDQSEKYHQETTISSNVSSAENTESNRALLANPGLQIK